MITGKQRSYLRKLGQELDPLVFIGKNDVTETVIRELDKLVNAMPDQKRKKKAEKAKGQKTEPAKTGKPEGPAEK